LYGTCVIVMPVIVFSISPARCPVPPLPDDEKFRSCGLFSGHFDQVGHSARRYRRMHSHDGRHCGDQSHRRKISEWLIGQSLVQVRRYDDGRGRRYHQGITVRCRLRHDVRADDAPAPGRFSTTTDCPSASDNLTLIKRARMSVPPPGA
jgi:hypothetical protein